MADTLAAAAAFAQDRQDRRRELIESSLEADYPGAAIRDPQQQQLDATAKAQQRQSQISEGVYQRLEAIGFRLGWCLAERRVWADTLMNGPRLTASVERQTRQGTPADSETDSTANSS